MAVEIVVPENDQTSSQGGAGKSFEELKAEWEATWQPPTHLDPLHITHLVVGNELDHAEQMREMRQGVIPTQQLLEIGQTPLDRAITAVRRFVSTITQPHF